MSTKAAGSFLSCLCEDLILAVPQLMTITVGVFKV